MKHLRVFTTDKKGSTFKIDNTRAVVATPVEGNALQQLSAANQNKLTKTGELFKSLSLNGRIVTESF